MNLNDYTALALRTESRLPAGGKISPMLLRLNHAALGIASETGELLSWLAATSAAVQADGAAKVDRANLIEELGDLLGYAALAADSLGFELVYLTSMGERPGLQEGWPTKSILAVAAASVRCLTKASGELADDVKRALFYGTTIDEIDLSGKIGSSLFFVLLAVRKLAEAAQTNLEHVAEVNIDKLRKRYGDRFDAEKAVTRDLAAERAVLEGGA